MQHGCLAACIIGKLLACVCELCSIVWMGLSTQVGMIRYSIKKNYFLYLWLTSTRALCSVLWIGYRVSPLPWIVFSYDAHYHIRRPRLMNQIFKSVTIILSVFLHLSSKEKGSYILLSLWLKYNLSYPIPFNKLLHYCYLTVCMSII